MKRINFLIVVLILLVCCAFTCTRNTDTCHRNITFVNKSPRDVYVYCNEYGGHMALDTTFFIPTTSSGLMSYVKSNETKSGTCASRDCFESWITETQYCLNVFILDVDVYETYPKDTILKYRMVKTITPTLVEMECSDWTVTYSGE